MIKISYLSWIATSLNLSGEKASLTPEISTVSDLQKWLSQRAGPFSLFGQENIIYCSVNGAVVADTAVIRDGDDVSFFAPIAGG